jgi:hypothetical protein
MALVLQQNTFDAMHARQSCDIPTLSYLPHKRGKHQYYFPTKFPLQFTI